MIVADFVKWEVNDEKIATVQVKDGVATLTAKAEGTVKVTCSIDTKKYPDLANLPVATFATEFPEKPFEVTFEVTVKPAEQQKPYVHSIGVYTPDSSSGATPISHVNADDPLIIPDDQAASYALREKVSAVLDPSAVDEPPVVYDCSSTKGLSAASGGRFADLEWRADNADGTEASKSDITVENGVITLKGKETYAVWCISPDGQAVRDAFLRAPVEREGGPAGRLQPAKRADGGD